MKYYCLGFVFDDSMEHVVLLMEKKWQASKLNGVGGHVEPGESYYEAMRREFREEAGADIPEERWWAFADMSGAAKDSKTSENTNWRCMCFVASLSLAEFENVVSQTDEPLAICEITDLPEDVTLDNLRWLIPTAVESYQDRELVVKASYRTAGSLQHDAHVRPRS